MKLRNMILLGLLVSFSAFAEVSVTTSANTTNEQKIKMSLENLLNSYKLGQWIYTDTVIVDASARTPHSHPVLTMSTQPEYLNSDTKLLSTFLHEQFHWHVILNGKPPKEEFGARIAEEFPNIKWKRPFGSGSKGGTLNHLIVCYLEYKALSHLVGEQEAHENISTNGYYTWVYETVANQNHKPIFEKLLDEFGINILQGKINKTAIQ